MAVSSFLLLLSRSERNVYDHQKGFAAAVIYYGGTVVEEPSCASKQTQFIKEFFFSFTPLSLSFLLSVTIIHIPNTPFSFSLALSLTNSMPIKRRKRSESVTKKLKLLLLPFRMDQERPMKEKDRGEDFSFSPLNFCCFFVYAYPITFCNRITRCPDGKKGVNK